MAYVKPQSPLRDKKSGDYFYPLTTVDQVIMDDDTRLNVALDILTILKTTIDDNGKFLRVVNGAPTWVAVPNAEEASF